MKSFTSVCFHWFSKTDLKKDPKADLSVVTNLCRTEMIDFSLGLFFGCCKYWFLQRLDISF